ncbi:MAG: hypothetical protein ACREBR_00380 [bacterium]
MSRTITRQTGAQIFEHLFKEVYEIHPEIDIAHEGNPLWLCIAQLGYDNILDILELSDSDIDDLVYNRNTDTDVPLPLKYKKTLKYTIWWRNYEAGKNQDNTTMDWYNLTSESFSIFRQEIVPLLQSTTKVRDMTQAMSNTGISDVGKFHSSIKRDTSSFPSFNGKNDDWFAFDRDLHATAKTQQIDRVLNVNETLPAFGTRDRALWDAQDTFLYSVLTTKVARGQAAIYGRESAATGSARIATRKCAITIRRAATVWPFKSDTRLN